MVDNSKEQKLFSKRAQDILANPKHALAHGSPLKSHQFWTWEFSLKKMKQNDFQSDKILTLNYLKHDGNILESLFLETISQMVLGRDIYFLLNLQFRELENFLRDENHLPVFDILLPISPEDSFKSVKNSLLATLLKYEIEKIEGAVSQLFGWSHLSLADKNRWSRTFISHLNNLFSRVVPLQLAIAENDKMAIVMNDFPVSTEVLEVLLKLIFNSADENSSFKVVAVQ